MVLTADMQRNMSKIARYKYVILCKCDIMLQNKQNTWLLS